MGLALLGAAEAHRGLPGPDFAAALVVFEREDHRLCDLATGGTRQGRFLRHDPEASTAVQLARSADRRSMSCRVPPVATC